MSHIEGKPLSGSSADGRLLPLLVVLFIGSGCASLIYEVVWFQLLSLVIGASSISLGVLLGTFMGGMCLGSLCLSHLISPTHHPLRVYALLELGIGVIGAVMLYAMPLMGGVYTAWAGSGPLGMSVRALVAAICLLPPTILMGATLPAIARWVKATPGGVSWLGFFYGANIGGAVAGSLLAGFYLLRIYDVAVATFVAVSINLAVAGMSFIFSKRTPYEADSSVQSGPAGPRTPWPLYVSIALSGMTALAAEVIWTRHLSILLGATVYTFALILAVFLFGLGCGSSVGSATARRLEAPRAALGVCQILLCAAIAWTAYSISEFLPYWPLDVTLGSSPWVTLQLDLIRVVWTILPPAVLWGASFPLALAAAARRGRDPGRLVGGLYAANTLGAIVGSLAASFILVIAIGSQHAQQLLILISAVSGLLMLAPATLARLRGGGDRFRTVAILATTGLAVVGLTATVPAIPGEFVAYGRFLPTRGQGTEVIYMGEGLTASVAVTRHPNGILNYHNAGKVQASSYAPDMRLQRMLGHLVTLAPENNQSFLVIGLGAGVTAGAVSIEPNAERVVIAEIEPLVPRVVSEYFGEYNFDVVDNPKVEIHIDDGRHFLLTTEEKFDGITSDPLDPWVKGAAALYTEEFWQLVRSRLNPGGVATVFVQLYESTEEAVKSEIATFLEVFPDGAVFANTIDGQGYDVVLFGQAEPGDSIDVGRMDDRLQSPEFEQVARSLGDVGFASVFDLLGTYSGQISDLSGWLEDAPINRDRNLRLQYLAGMGLNLYRADVIFRNMIAGGVVFPERLFTGPTAMLDELARRVQLRVGP